MDAELSSPRMEFFGCDVHGIHSIDELRDEDDIVGRPIQLGGYL